MVKGDTGQFFWEIIAYEHYNFYQQTSKFLEGYGFNNLIQEYFLEEWEQIY